LEFIYSKKYDCNICTTRCDGKSKEAYIFSDDIAKSEKDEEIIASSIREKLLLEVEKTPSEAYGLADLELMTEGKLICRVEVKHQDRTFMSVRRLLPHGDLLPYETIALNLSDLERYIAQYKVERIPTFVIWHLKRPCIGDIYCGNEINVLEASLNLYRTKRTFRRASTKSDYVDGKHKGVTVNYHFSLKEMISLNEILQKISAIPKH